VETEEKRPFLEHLEELRQRLIRCLIVVGAAFVVCWYFSKDLFQFLSTPLFKTLPKGSSMIFTSPAEAFIVYMKLAFYCALFFSSPYILYQAWMFIAPALYAHEKRYVLPFMIIAIGLFVTGMAFAYFVVFPLGFKFLMSLSTEFIKPMVRIQDYLSFTMTLLLAFGAVFELPVFVFFLAKMGIITHKTLSRNRRFAILIIFIVAGVLTPGPDVFSQLSMAGPLLILYEISIILAKMAERKPKTSHSEGPTA
jgi:sec-independent protein translocase protein TatC